MKLKNTFTICGGIGVVTLLMTAPWASSQPPGGGPGATGASGRGGGLRGAAVAFDYSNNDGWTSLFDGKTMNGWAGNTNLWSVKDGSLYIHPSCEQPTGTTYIHWTGGEPGDFALKYELKGTEQVNGGMQFRSYMTADAKVGLRYPTRGGGFGGWWRTRRFGWARRWISRRILRWTWRRWWPRAGLRQSGNRSRTRSDGALRHERPAGRL